MTDRPGQFKPKPRKPKKREVSRSFRIPPAVDRALASEAKQKGWTKSFLIREILISHLRFQKAAKQITNLEAPLVGDGL